LAPNPFGWNGFRFGAAVVASGQSAVGTDGDPPRRPVERGKAIFTGLPHFLWLMRRSRCGRRLHIAGGRRAAEILVALVSRRAVLVAAAALALPRHAGAALPRFWYVDNRAGGAGDGRSWGSAWRRAANIAWSEIAPGDRIYFSGGAESRTYTESLEITRSGADGLPITIAAAIDPGHDGEVIFDFGASDNRLRISDCAHVEVSGFTLRNGTSGSVVRLRDLRGGVVLSDNIIETGPGEPDGNARGIDVRGCSGEYGPNVILGNRISTPENTTAQTDGIYSMDNGHGALRIEGNAIFVHNTDNGGHSDCFQSYRDGSMAVINNLFQGPLAGRNNHPVWIADIQDGGLIEIRGNRCVNRNEGSNLTVWRSGAEAGTGSATIVGNEILGGSRALNFERNAAIEIFENIVEPDPDGVAYFIALEALRPENVERNQIFAPAQSIASVLGRTKSWRAWQRDGFDLNGHRADRFAGDGTEVAA